MGSNFVGERRTMRVPWIVLFLLVVGTDTSASAVPIAPSSATALLFEFYRPVSENTWQAVANALARVDLPKLLGHPVLLVQRKRVAKGTEFLDVIQATLSGDCAAGRDIDSTASGGSLGWVYLVGGKIQPFVFVDCDQVARILDRELRDRPDSERARVMAYAISYVIVHELTHIATQNAGHQETGILKAYATKRDLLSDSPDIPVHVMLVAPKLASCPAHESKNASPLENGGSRRSPEETLWKLPLC